MKIGILHRPGSFSDRWIAYCDKNNIEYIILNQYSDSLIKDAASCDVIVWHHHHGNNPDQLIAKQILAAFEQVGKQVFPNFNTGWHFDDKLGQKYLLEAVKAPFVRSYAFYDKQSALDWASSAQFPKVFKLRGGAGSHNVILAHNLKDARKLIKRAFGRGFKEQRLLYNIKYQYKKYKGGKISLQNLVNYTAGELLRKFNPHIVNNAEGGYAYFQDFMSGNDHDIRVIVIGNKAFAIKRICRNGDFRASGSGIIRYSREEIDERCVALSFEIAQSLKSQCVGFDWVYDKDNNPFIIEMSYGFTASGYDDCEGYWTEDMQWHGGKGFDFCGWMVDEIISKFKK